MDVSSYEKGATMLGVGLKNAPGIDAVDLTNAVGISLKTASNATAVVRNSEVALDSVQSAGFFGVKLYIHAKTVSLTDINQNALRRFLGDRIAKIVVFGKDGTIELNVP